MPLEGGGEGGREGRGGVQWQWIEAVVCISLCQVHIHREKVTWPGARIQKPGEGMPNYDNNKIRGTLYITFDIDFPRGTFSEADSEGVCSESMLEGDKW